MNNEQLALLNQTIVRKGLEPGSVITEIIDGQIKVIYHDSTFIFMPEWFKISKIHSVIKMLEDRKSSFHRIYLEEDDYKITISLRLTEDAYENYWLSVNGIDICMHSDDLLDMMKKIRDFHSTTKVIRSGGNVRLLLKKRC